MKTITRHVNIGTRMGRQMGQGRIVGMACASMYLSLSFADALRLEAVAGSYWRTWSPQVDQRQADNPRHEQAGRPEATNEAGKPQASAEPSQPSAARRRSSLARCVSARS